MSSITIAALCWQPPNNGPLFSNLSVTLSAPRTGLVWRNGTGKTSLLRLIAGELVPSAGTITTPPKVGLLHQNPEQLAHATLADLFGVAEQIVVLARAERGEATASELADLDWTLEARIQASLAKMVLNQRFTTPLQALSGGQRTRAGLAALLFARPDVLLLDEPTNHLDCVSRQHVLVALRSWQGCLVVASHDRGLLDEMDAIVELTSVGARTYGGPYSVYRATKAEELASAKLEQIRAERAVIDTKSRAQIATERKARTDRQGKRLRVSGSQSKLLLNAAKERSQASASSAARLRNRQNETAKAALDSARAAVEVIEPVLMGIPSCGLTSTRDVLKVQDLAFGYRSETLVFEGVSFSIVGPERIAITGGNGAIKSTLLACIQGQLQPRSGSVTLRAPSALIDQDLSLLRPTETLCETFERLDPEASENDRRAVLARFLFRGEDSRQRIGKLSGGQRVRAGLACTLGHSLPRQLLLLDEPNNHLDLDAVEALEAALSAYDGAILVVSHDEAFLARIGVERRICL